NPTAWLVFNEAGDLGKLSSKMRQLTEIPGGHEEFAKGMVAEFALKSYDLDPHWTGHLLELTDPHKQRARIVLKSQGFDAVELRIGGKIDKLRGAWNAFAFRINQLSWRERQSKSGEKLLDTRGILPTFSVTAHWLSYFIGALRRDRSRQSTTPGGV